MWREYRSWPSTLTRINLSDLPFSLSEDIAMQVDLSNCRYDVVRDAALSLGLGVSPSPLSRVGHSSSATSTNSFPSRDTIAAEIKSKGTGRTGKRRSSVLSLVPLYWSDRTFTPSQVARIQQERGLCNHFPGVERISRKIGLAECLSRYQSRFPHHYHIAPLSFTSWSQYSHHQERAGRSDDRTKGSGAGATPQQLSEGKWYICKPTAGCQGRGVRLVRKVTPAAFVSSEVEGTSHRGKSSGSADMVVQEYVDRPFLIEGRKCDLRCYVLVTSFDPLEVFFYEDGIVRICRDLYEAPTVENCKTSTIHLANYAVNKANPSSGQSTGSFSMDSDLNASAPSTVAGDGQGSASSSSSPVIKLPFSSLNRLLMHRLMEIRKETEPAPSNRLDAQLQDVWDEIHLSIVKTLIAGQEHVVRSSPFNPNRLALADQNPTQPGDQKPTGSPSPATPAGMIAESACRTCFEILGFDIMLDDALKPWIIEVNHSPSWTTDTEFDYELKKRVIADALRIVRYTHAVDRRRGLQKPSMTTVKRKLLECTRATQSDGDGDEERNSLGFVPIFPSSAIQAKLRDLLTEQAELIRVLRGQ
jgi:hypothetical protein